MVTLISARAAENICVNAPMGAMSIRNHLHKRSCSPRRTRVLRWKWLAPYRGSIIIAFASHPMLLSLPPCQTQTLVSLRSPSHLSLVSPLRIPYETPSREFQFHSRSCHAFLCRRRRGRQCQQHEGIICDTLAYRASYASADLLIPLYQLQANQGLPASN